jgi:pSer/pThr/pTyr-binding forkhead associated (FHA) protein
MWTVIVRDPSGKLHSKTPLKVGVIRIGRGNDCDIVLKSGAVSRLHGRLLVGEGSSLIYSDEQSANGSLVDGQKVSTAVDVNEHSLINIGGFMISLEREGAGAAGDADKTLQFSAADMARLMQQAPPPRSAAPPPATPRPPVPPPPPPQIPVPPPSAPARPAVPLQSPLEGMKFVIPETPPATRQVEQVQHESLSASMGHLLEQQIRGIQSRRQEVEQTQRSVKEQFEHEWREAIRAARELQGQLHGNAKVIYYVVTRDEQEVSVKIADGSKRGSANLILSRRHPESGKVQEGYVWFGVFGEESRSYREPKIALEDFVRRVASKLA